MRRNLTSSGSGSGGIRRLYVVWVALFFVMAACRPADTVDPTPTPETPTPDPAAQAACSAAELSPALPDQELPEETARMRADIAAAAVECDYEELERLAQAGERPFNFSFGAGPGDSAADHWRQLEDEEADLEVTGDLVRLLGLEPATVDAGDDTIYVWPAAATRDVPTDEDWEALAQVLPEEAVSQMRQESETLGIGYLYYRIGITQDGDWIYFVAGD